MKRSLMRSNRTAAIATGAVIAVASLVWLGASANYRSCVEAAEAKFPAVPVSAFVTEDPGEVGPLKVSFVNERTAAVDDCSRFF